ncbi:MAG TPA: sensor domain-containing diguanylate cyclase [Deltaproteobacteria bacterium]|nr:sensor domain-containing diguanylate cyclase [Deltaproteobacteria bacterium]
MDLDIETLHDILSPYILLFKGSRLTYVSDALRFRMGYEEREMREVINQKVSFDDLFEQDPARISLPTKENAAVEFAYTKTLLNDTGLVALTDEDRQADTALENGDSEIFHRMISDSQSCCLIIFRGHIAYTNKTFCSLLGYAQEELQGRQIVDIVSRESRESFIRACDAATRQSRGLISSCDILFTRSTGTRIEFRLSGGWITGRDTECLWLMLEDISEKKRIERALREEQQRFAELYEKTPSGILYISPRGIILDCNESVCTIAGHSKMDITGRSFMEFVAAHEIEPLSLAFSRLFLEGREIKGNECTLKTRMGHLLTIEYNAQVITRKGHRTRALMMFADITEKKTLEIELLEKNAEMERTLWDMAEVKDALEARAGELNKASEELKMLNEKLSLLSITDGLTDIYNHRHFQDRLTEELERVHRFKDGVVSLLILDIDDFKKFNDTYGHQFGDMVLKQLANLLRHSVRTIDILARYGGEEFAIILPSAQVHHALKVGERICEAVRTTPFTFGDGTKVKVTVSIGVGTLTHGQGDKAELVRRADSALYAAKAKWKDRVEVWEED